VLSDKDFERAIARIRELGWYAKIQPEKDGIVSSVAKYENLDVPVLIDHMARPDPLRGNEDPNLRKMLELLSKGNFWVMLSLGEKTSKKGPPWDDVIPIARAYIEAAPDRARASLPLRARRGGTEENPGNQSGKAVRLR
jgi:2-pyrone-4,6-dicarboxylate lactonase